MEKGFGRNLLDRYLNAGRHLLPIGLVVPVGKLQGKGVGTGLKRQGIRRLAFSVVDVQCVGRNRFTHAKASAIDENVVVACPFFQRSGGLNAHAFNTHFNDDGVGKLLAIGEVGKKDACTRWNSKVIWGSRFFNHHGFRGFRGGAAACNGQGKGEENEFFHRFRH